MPKGLRRAARFCRTVAAGAVEHGEAADALATSIEMIAAREDEESLERARKWQDEP
jgi:hypothetical protein